MRCIIVPKDKEADVLLDYDEASSDQLLTLYFDNAEFKELWDAGVFSAINEIAESMIDVYEDDGITDRYKLQQVINSDIFNKKLSTNKLDQIKVLFEEALKRETGIYFYF